MAESEKFKKWINIEICRITGEQAKAEEYADKEINSDRIKVEIKNNGNWVEI